MSHIILDSYHINNELNRNCDRVDHIEVAFTQICIHRATKCTKPKINGDAHLYYRAYQTFWTVAVNPKIYQNSLSLEK